MITYTDLVKQIAKNAHMTNTQTKICMDATINTFMELIESGESFTLYKFGSFNVVDREPRVARNPQTNEQMSLPAYRSVKFKPSYLLKDAAKASMKNK